MNDDKNSPSNFLSDKLRDDIDWNGLASDIIVPTDLESDDKFMNLTSQMPGDLQLTVLIKRDIISTHVASYNHLINYVSTFIYLQFEAATKGWSNEKQPIEKTSRKTQRRTWSFSIAVAIRTKYFK